MARFRVNASAPGRRDRRVVWATDIGTALIVARDARGWGATAAIATRISDWTALTVISGGLGHAGNTPRKGD